jgi:indole-3-glycerol phosphate synthase
MAAGIAALRGELRCGAAMSGFLDEMARASGRRVAAALRQESLAALQRRASNTPAAAPLRLSPSGFDVIAEIKLRSPAAGQLGQPQDDWLGRVSAYARAGAAAVSVLTEPSRFDGSLDHLLKASEVLAPLGVPAMRKDFLVDPYQVLEARAAGAGGVLVIVRMLSRTQICELLDAASAHGMFALLEAFDAQDVESARDVLTQRPPSRAADEAPVLVGINCRDLQTLQVVPQRFEILAPMLPAQWSAVAESGVASAADAQRVQKLGYSLALIGTALMTRDDPAQLLREIFAATRTVQT